MTDTNLESGQNLQDGGTANSAHSQAPGDKPTSTFDEAKLLERIGALVKDEVGKAVQSSKDRRFDKIEKTLSDYQPVLEKVKERLSPEDFATLQRDLEWEEMKRRTGLLTSTSPTEQVGNQQATAAQPKSDVVKELGLDENDPDVARVLRESGPDPLKLAKVAVSKAKTPAPDPSGAPAMGTPPAPPTDGQEALAAAYSKEVASLRGNVLAVSQLQAKYRQKGLKI